MVAPEASTKLDHRNLRNRYLTLAAIALLAITGCSRDQYRLKADEDAPLKILVTAWDALTRAGFRVKDVPARILLRKPGADDSP